MPWLVAGAGIVVWAILSGHGQALADAMAQPAGSIFGAPYEASFGSPSSSAGILTASYAGQSTGLSPSYTSTDAIAAPTYASAPAPAAPAPIPSGGTYIPPSAGSGYKPAPTPQLNPVYTQLQVAYPPSISSPNQTQITPRSGHISF